MKTIRAQVDALLRSRFTVTDTFWNNKIDKIRLEVLGNDCISASFPVKLHKITSEPSLDQEIFWLSDGETFAIDRELYERRIMGVFFDQTTIRSMQNLLRKYGFKTELGVCLDEFIPSIANKYMVYSHPFFVKGRQDLLFNIKIIQQSNDVHQEAKREVSGSLGLLNKKNSNDSFCDLIEDVIGEPEETVLN
jgi:hypothetical protein